MPTSSRNSPTGCANRPDWRFASRTASSGSARMPRKSRRKPSRRRTADSRNCGIATAFGRGWCARRGDWPSTAGARTGGGPFESRRACQETADPTTDGIAAANERAERLWRAIDDLPEKLREAIVLSAIEGYDVREVALLLGVPEGTVKSRLFLARKGLAQRLQCLVTDTRTR